MYLPYFRCLLPLSFLFFSACGGSGGDTMSEPSNPGDNFVAFESGQVRPLALTPDGNLLLAANTPNNSVEIYSVDDTGLTAISSIPVGMEPVAIATPNNSQAWVVNHLSDSVSIIDLTSTPPKVIRTLHVGDEPRDIVFAGTDNKFAFISTAHRGQNGADDNPIDAQLTTPSVGRADIWVFDTSSSDSTLGGAPATVINLFGDTPRALTVSNDGTKVYAAVFLSGNKTTTLGEDFLVKDAPTQSADNITQPDTGLIVQHDGANWVDDGGTVYNDKVPFSLPDYDVFEIDASLTTPAATATRYSGVGTVLFNMVTHPSSGAIYISNQEAHNLTRFEGPGSVGTTVRGHIVDSQITVIKNDIVTPVNLNITTDTSRQGTQAERDKAISIPLEMAISNNGNTLYVSGFGAQKIAAYNIADLDAGSVTPSIATQVTLTAGGPSAIVLDEARNRLYTLTRFDNGISIIDTTTLTETAHLTMHNPEPDDIIAGRPFLYDSIISSSHGTSSCASCHVFADTDGLAWDLGNPDETAKPNPNAFVNTSLTPLTPPSFHPMKGPMTTQSLRGMAGNGPMHWRGDRTGQNKTANESLELAAFKEFNEAFTGLLGNDTELPAQAMQLYSEFALQLTYPPSPIRQLNNSLTTSQAAGQNIYFNQVTTGGFFQCNTCHVVDPANNHFGTAGLSTVEGDDISQQFKVPHLRNMYQKVGKFGNSGKFSTDTTNYGEQIKGFGFMHDGGMDTLDKFLSGDVFSFDINPTLNIQKRAQVVDFVLAMDSEMAPVVGQQVTLTSSSGSDVHARIDLLKQRSLVTSPRSECDLIAKGVINNQQRGYLLLADGTFQSDKKSEILSDSQLRALVNSNTQTLTFTCAPAGSGIWMGIDRDEDGNYDRDEIDAGTNPLS